METLKALNAANLLHAGQTRKTGEPYVYHPVRVACELLSLGIDHDFVLATALLHDVIEDCGIDSTVLRDQYDISTGVIGHVIVLSKEKGRDASIYYERVSRHWVSSLVKISDRCHNVSTMVDGFTLEKMHEYLLETDEYVIPLCKHTKDFYPEYSNQVFVMKYHIQSVCSAIEGCLRISNISSTE